jgi:uncharacterized protein YdaU (DUF1376 family)
MCDLPSFPLFVSDYLGKTHPGLTIEQHGCYLLLLMFSWQRPTCALPDDDGWLQSRLGIHGNKWRVLRKTVLERFFEKDENGEYFSKRLRKEREFVLKSRRNAREKAEKRWAIEKENNNLAENRHMHPTPPHPKEERKKDTSYPSTRARDPGSEDLFSEGRGCQGNQHHHPAKPTEVHPHGEAGPSNGKAPPRGQPPTPPDGAAPPRPQPVAASAGEAGGCDVRKRRRKPKAQQPKPQPDPKFEEFWATCLVKEGRVPALEEWQVAITKAPPDEIIAAAKRYAEKRAAEIAAGDLPKWTKRPKNWLHDERWTDEPAPAGSRIDGGQNEAPINGHRPSKGDDWMARSAANLRKMGAWQ